MKEWGIRSVPTFNFYVKGEKVDAQGGANPDKLKVKIAEVKSKCVAA
jgi:predicted DsbA family dithiol-disulfide isomerase